MSWVITDNKDISFEHCNRPAYWEGDAVICSKCQETMPEAEAADSLLLAEVDKLQAALDLVLEDLTESNAHTIAALLESQYRTGYDMDKVERAYKAAQWELFGTR